MTLLDPPGRAPGGPAPLIPRERAELLSEGLAALERGWVLTPADGRPRPFELGWQNRTRTSEVEVREWVAAGHNLAVVCGPASNITGIDVDPQHGGSVDHLGLPPTAYSLTPSGGRHLYFQHAPGVGCRPLAPGVDVRGEGGALTLPGSVRLATGQRYSWGANPDTAGQAELPAEALAILSAPRRPAQPAPPPRPDEHERARRWAVAALRSECERVAGCREGQRNVTLNLAAFRMGQLEAAGVLSDPTPELQAAADACGLDRDEARATIESGLDGGRREPRFPALREPAPATPRLVVRHPADLRAEQLAPLAPLVLIPGQHTDDQAVIRKQGNSAFADQVLEHFAPGALYRRAHTDLVGVVSGIQFRAIDSDTMRLLADPPTVEIFTWEEVRVGKSRRHDRVFTPCSTANAGLLISRARTHPNVRELQYVARWPVYGPNLELIPPGYHATTSTLAEYQPLKPMQDLRECIAVLRDLVVDFPFEDDQSLGNFLGLMLTVLLRPALGRVPFFLINAPVHGSGKTILVQQCLGRALLGCFVPGGPLPELEEEREKRVTADAIAGGAPILFYDNLPEHMESQVIASMITMPVWHGRILGQSSTVDAPMNSILVGTGNNTQLSGELARRAVPIRLTPGPHPEARTDFQHVIEEYAPARCEAVRAAVYGWIESWKRAGAPRSRVPMGSFESWSAIVGGILEHGGFQHLGNLTRWRSELDPEGQALEAFADRIVQEWGFDIRGTAGELLPFARGHFPRIDDTPEKRQAQALGTMLSRHVDRHLQYGTLRSQRTREGQVFYIENPKRT